MLNLAPLLETLSIKTKNLEIVKLDMTARSDFGWAQRQFVAEVEKQYNAGQPVRIIVLKGRQLGLCLSPSTRVLTADLRWVTIENLEVGQELVATDETFPGGRGRGRKMRTGVVEAKKELHQPAYRITFDTGQEVVATGQHRFLCKVRGGNTTCWRDVNHFKVGDKVRYVTQPWEGQSYEDGWFGGFIDGEGSFAKARESGAEMAISQVDGAVLERGRAYLQDRGYNFRVESDDRVAGSSSKLGTKVVHKLVVSRMDEMFRLLGQTRPARFAGRRWWEGKDLPGKKTGASYARIVKIEWDDYQRVIDVQTSTKTFIAEGLVSHNSTISEAILFLWGFIHPGTSSLVLTHQQKQSVELFQMAKLYWETWPFKDLYSLKYETKQTMDWHETRSRMQVGTAANPNSFRGSTFHAAHLSESAFYNDPETLFTGLNATLPERHGSIVVNESTANGVGNWFYEKWQEAKEGDSAYKPLFFPWFKHYEYATPTTLTSKLELDADERRLIDLGASYENIAWRRRKIRDYPDLSSFLQEFPADDVEAFVVSGRPVFSHRHVTAAYEPHPGYRGRLVDDPRGRGHRVQFVTDPHGPLVVYKQPRLGDTRNDRYFVSADPSETTVGDPACMQVINRQTGEQVAVWHGRINPIHLAHEMMRLGWFYNGAMLCPEVEGGGQATMATILTSGYDNVWLDKRADRIRGSMNVYGFSTNWNRKQWVIGTLQRRFLDGSISIHDPKTYHQLINYVVHDNGELGNSDHTPNDDAVMALAIGVTASETEGPFLADQGPLAAVHDIYGLEQLA
jgi:hypothetical protein